MDMTLMVLLSNVSSDVIQELRVTVNEGGKPVWYQVGSATSPALGLGFLGQARTSLALENWSRLTRK